MKLAILSCAPKCYSTKRLLNSALERGHEAKVLRTLSFAIDLERNNPDLFYNQDNLTPYDAVLPRIGASITYFGTAVVRQFEQMDVFCANTSESITRSRDKLQSLQLLSSHDVGIPKTTYVRGKKDLRAAINRVGGAPLVIKLIEGTHGMGVLLASTTATAISIIELLLSQKQKILIQRFVSESKGTDVRALVVGNQVVAAMRRVARGDEFRSNVHRGGKTEKVELTPEFEKAAIKAAQILGLHVAGVDMLEAEDGPKILEVNSSPGLKGIEKCTKVDVAGNIVDYIAAHVDLPEIDIRQKLTAKDGFVVSEIRIPDLSQFVGKTIADVITSQTNVKVLSLTRDAEVILNPSEDLSLREKDIALCYGKVDEVRAIIPEQVSERRSPAPAPLD